MTTTLWSKKKRSCGMYMSCTEVRTPRAYLPIIDQTTLYHKEFAPPAFAFFSIASPCSRARCISISQAGFLKTSSRNFAITSLRSCCFSSGVNFSICFLIFSMDTFHLSFSLFQSLWSLLTTISKSMGPVACPSESTERPHLQMDGAFFQYPQIDRSL